MSYEEFCKLYNAKEISTEDIKKIVGRRNYANYRKQALKNNDIRQRPSNLRFGVQFNKYKYYHFDKDMGMYRVHKVKNGEYTSYGFFKTEEEAKEMVEKCKKLNWDKNKIKREEC